MLCIFAILFLVGLVLFGIGMNGRRVGQEPRCLSCDYDLTGITSNQCPECGSAIGPTTVVAGRFQRRRGLLIISVVLIGVSGAGFLGLASVVGRKIDLSRHYPLVYLLYRAKHNDPSSVQELRRRVQLGVLTTAQRRKIIETAVAERSRAGYANLSPVWADVLALLNKRGLLSPEDETAFYADLARVQFQVRRRVRVGEPIIVSVGYVDRGSPTEVYTLEYELKSLSVGDTASIMHWMVGGVYPLMGHSARHWSETMNFPAESEGDVSVRATLYYAIYAPDADPEIDEPLYVREQPYDITVEVLPRDAPDPIRMIDTLPRGLHLEDVISIESAGLSCKDYLFFRRCLLVMWFYLHEPVPVDLAFDVSVFNNYRTVSVGRMSWPAGRGGWRAVVSKPMRELQGDTVMPILRGSREAAMWTPDCYDVWSGEVTLEPVWLHRKEMK